jgi:hypothetical protein
MKNRRARRREKLGARRVRNRAAAMAACLVVTLVAGGLILAAGGARWFAAKSVAPSPQGGDPLAPGNPSKEYVYAGGRLVATEEPPGTACAPISAPALNTSVSGSVITLNWTVPQQAATFDVERGLTRSGPFTPLATNLPLTTTTFQDAVPFSGVSPDGTNNVVTYIYRIVARNGTCSQASNLDWATNITFGETLTPQQTVIKAHHMTELRVAVNAVWKAAQQTPATITWTDPAGGTPQGLTQFLIKKIHVDELRSKLNQAMDAIQPGYSAAHPYTDPTLTQYSTPVKAIHLVDLRDRVK